MQSRKGWVFVQRNFEHDRRRKRGKESEVAHPWRPWHNPPRFPRATYFARGSNCPLSAGPHPNTRLPSVRKSNPVTSRATIRAILPPPTTEGSIGEERA
jgi:hypothetical protein